MRTQTQTRMKMKRMKNNPDSSSMSATFHKGDNLKIISEQIKDKSIDFIYFNPPYATTRQKWDEKLNWKKLFPEFFRVLKDDGVLAIHCSVPFNYVLIREAPRAPNYSWYWKKEGTTNPLLANTQPLRNTEEILVWSNKRNRYNPQRVGNEKRRIFTLGGNRPKKDGSAYYGHSKSCDAERTFKEVEGKYQTHLIDMKRHRDGFSTRPRELVELMINSYTKEGDVILDPTCYLGMCGAIAKEMKRNWIGIDKNFYPLKLMCAVNPSKKDSPNRLEKRNGCPSSGNTATSGNSEPPGNPADPDCPPSQP